ncbi:WD repeat-containing protein 18 [Pimephales promelas]|uniref:WD repeat-containing protein 18 n=1 Tax=Pimephales promelas TaxID=90988 RepID=UPI001955B7F9|nr:WD repeat-containing protein 18 [Pimephales promelas]KAG1960204.1 protein ROOT INITIATION DEFECTIVE [Pimephales promelas]
MSAPAEVVLSADSAGQLFNCAVFDPNSGAEFLTYRGGNTSSRSLTVLNGEYILGAQLCKNFINVWEIQRKDQLQQKIVCPGIVTCLCASPNGLYVLAGIAEAIYLWEVSTGNLLAILSRHYQDLSCIHFTDDSSHFVSGGKDNIALIWNLSSVVQLDSSRTPEPRHILSRHSLPITDIHCGLMGPQARVATASLDQTVKVWEISSGEMLLSVLFDVGIMSVTFDPCEYFLFCGGSDGNIFQVSLCSTSLSRDKTFQSDSDGDQVFKGHRNLVTCLSVSMDGTLLLSGSNDETLRMWDVQSKQCIWSFNHKGPVTNAAIIPAPANMFLSDSRPAVPLPRFSRHLNPSEQGDGMGTGGMCLRLGANTQEPEGTYLEKADELYSLMCAVTDKSMFGDGENTKVRVSELEEEMRTLKKINKDLYEFSSQLLTKPN